MKKPITEMDLHDIIADWLRSHGYDGLYCDDGECDCCLSDLMPCGEPSRYCFPGVFVEKPKGCENADFYIGPREEVPNDVR